MLQAFANCFKIPELRKKIWYTLGLLAVCRVLAAVPCPGINSENLSALFERLNESSGDAPGMLGMFNMFTGGALQQFALAALGIMPYITASIIIQLMTPVFGNLERWKREGENGFQKINQLTRYLTLIICVIQGYIMALGMENPEKLNIGFDPTAPLVNSPGLSWRLMTVLMLTCGTMLLMWLGEQITEKGVGNGASLIITIGIIERLPNVLQQLWVQFRSGGSGDVVFTPIHLMILLALFVIVTAATVALTQGVRKIPIQYARSSVGRQGAVQQGGFFPLRVNYASVMPIIFAQALLMIPGMVIPWLAQSSEKMQWVGKLSFLFEYARAPYMLIYAALLILFAFFWVANQFNPIQIADDLKRGGAYIPGVRPGKATADFLDWSMTRVTTTGALCLVGLALLPMIISDQMNVSYEIGSYFGGSSLLIIVGVMLDSMRQIESHLLMHGYDTFMQQGRIRNTRRGSSV